MKRLSLIVLLSMSGAMQASQAAADGLGVANYLSQQGWSIYENGAKFANPAPEIAPLMYYGKGSNVPSCGLLSAAAGTPRFIEILAAEAGEQYPHCAGINDAAAFKLDGKDYLVFAYLDRDTRDETYEQFFYVFKDKAGEYAADEQLNQGAGTAANAFPARKAGANAALKAIDGVRLARTYMLKKSQPAMELQSRDLIADNKGGFAVFLDRSAATCSFVLDNGIELSTYSSELFAEHRACQNYLASSKFDTPGKTYYLGLFKGGDASTQVAIFSVAKNTSAVRAEKELASSANATHKVTDIKSLKAYLAEVERTKDK